jgi:hypothetical protein
VAIPTDEELNAYGVVQLAREWTPRGMYIGSGKELFDALHAMEAFALNPGYAFADYVPDAFDPYLCLDEELKGVARIHGVHVHDWSVDKQILRRLCLVAQQARAWRGASTSLLAVISAVTGAQTMVVPWTMLRTCSMYLAWT